MKPTPFHEAKRILEQEAKSNIIACEITPEMMKKWDEHFGDCKPALTLDMISRASKLRLPLFKNSKGVAIHEKGMLEWTPAQWLQALVGEVGEYANWRKKYERGDITEEEFLCEAKKELADVQCYLSILANILDINLGEAVREKFNEVSDSVGCDIKL